MPNAARGPGRRSALLGVLLLAVGLPARTLHASADLQLTVTDLAGQNHPLGDWPHRDPVAFVFMSPDCPISNGYIPELNRLFADVQKKHPHVQFFGVVSARGVTRAAAAKHDADFHVAFPVLFDASGELAAVLKPKDTPESFVVAGDGTVIYRGRIDDLYADLGHRRETATRHDFADAIDAASHGKTVAAPETDAVGCAFESRSPLNSADAAGAPTFARDVAPILFASCTTCHRPGEVAPFPLTGYDEAKRHLGETHFAWIGPFDDASPFYYRILNPVILVEFDHQLIRG